MTATISLIIQLMSLVVKLENLGLIHYSKALRFQYKLSEDVQKGGLNRIIVCQHFPIYTFGRRQKAVVGSMPLGAETVLTNRGGLSTFHGPGQLLCYPILDLRKLRRDRNTGGVRWYVNSLEKSVIDTCSYFGVKSYKCEHVGVWTKGEKICAIGVHIQRGVTTHGLALNCTTDLSWFESIEPCGIIGKKMTSLSMVCGKLISVNEVSNVLLNKLRDVLKIEFC